jgi:integrase
MPKLTQTALRRLIKKSGRHSDGGGLYFRAIGGGKAYFVYRYRHGGKEREVSLGPFPELTLADARAKHADLRKRVLNDKADPLADKRAARTAPTAVPTFGDVADAYVETHEATWRNAKHRYQWRQTLTDYCGPIRLKPVDQIATADVPAVLKPLWSRAPETASRLRGRIQAVLDAAQAHGHIADDEANPARWKGHLNKLLPRPAKLSRGHQKALPYADVPGFMQRLRASDNMAALALEFLILTATRTNETLGAQWREVDLENAIWTIPPSRMKTGDAFSVPLPARAIALLTEARARARKEPEPDSLPRPAPRSYPSARVIATHDPLQQGVPMRRAIGLAQADPSIVPFHDANRDCCCRSANTRRMGRDRRRSPALAAYGLCYRKRLTIRAAWRAREAPGQPSDDPRTGGAISSHIRRALRDGRKAPY